MRFVLIDGFVELEPGRRAVAVKRFSAHEDFLEDHFPGFPVVPGVLITEAMGQAAGWLLAASHDFSRWPLLTMIERAKFRRLVAPEQELRLTVFLEPARGDDVVARAEASVEAERVAEARLVFHLFDPPLSAEARPRFRAWAESVFQTLLPAPACLPGAHA